MTDTAPDMSHHENVRRLAALVPDNGERKVLLGRYAGKLGLTRDVILERYPGFDVAMRKFEDFEHVLAYFAQDLTRDRHGAADATQARFDSIVDEILLALINDAMSMRARVQLPRRHFIRGDIAVLSAPVILARCHDTHRPYTYPSIRVMLVTEDPLC